MQGMCVCICSIEQATLAEWLRRWPAKPLCIARAGSNPAASCLFAADLRDSHNIATTFDLVGSLRL